MKIVVLSKLIQSESDCETYLKKVGILRTFTDCSKCHSSKIGRIRRNRHKCYSWKYEWNIKKGRVLERIQINLSNFITCIKLFEYGLTEEKSSIELKMNHESVAEIYNLIRLSLAGLNKNSCEMLFKNLNRTKQNCAIYIAKSRHIFNVSLETSRDILQNNSNFAEIKLKLPKKGRNNHNSVYSYKK